MERNLLAMYVRTGSEEKALCMSSIATLGKMI